jgi:hypothetical protein
MECMRSECDDTRASEKNEPRCGFCYQHKGDTYTKSTPVTQSKPMGGIRLTRSDARDISPTCAQVINLWRTCGGN